MHLSLVPEPVLQIKTSVKPVVHCLTDHGGAGIQAQGKWTPEPSLLFPLYKHKEIYFYYPKKWENIALEIHSLEFLHKGDPFQAFAHLRVQQKSHFTLVPLVCGGVGKAEGCAVGGEGISEHQPQKEKVWEEKNEEAPSFSQPIFTEYL